MAYLPLKLRPKFSPQRQTSVMAKRGVNLRDNPQFLNVEYALDIQNYYVTSDGSLVKRQGAVKLEDRSTTDAVIFSGIYDENTIIYCYADKVCAFDIPSATSTTIKTYSGTSTTYSGDRYGGYYFVTNGKSELERMTRTLAYDAQTANFTVGSVITGATSGAKATILADTDAGATGTLTLAYISGVFADNEIITDLGTGSATVNGTIGWATTTVTGSPIGRIVKAIGSRLFVAQLVKDETAIWYSNVDAGTNPPFTTWTVGTNASDPGTLYFRNAGKINCISEFGQNIVVMFCEYGKWAFYIDTIDSAGTLKKVDRIVMQKLDGGGKACLYTEEGLFYVNNYGLWKLMSLGQQNVPFSEQEENDSMLLGSRYFNNINLARASISYNLELRLILVSCAQDSAANNLVIVYALPFKAFSFFKGWAFNNIFSINGSYYAGSSVASKLYEVFDGYSDDGNDIFTRFSQEIKLGGLESKQEIQKAFFQGRLSSSSNVKIDFDIYTRQGIFVKNKTTWQWTPAYAPASPDGFSGASWGVSSFGGDVEASGLVNCFDGFAPRIQNFNRLIIRIEENSMLPLEINWFTLIGRIKSEIRRRSIVKLS